MSTIRPLDLQNLYLRMGEVSREQAKEIHKEEKKQHFDVRINKHEEETADHSVNATNAIEDQKKVKEHEEKSEQQQRGAAHELPEQINLNKSKVGGSAEQKKGPFEVKDPDLGKRIDIKG